MPLIPNFLSRFKLQSSTLKFLNTILIFTFIGFPTFAQQNQLTFYWENGLNLESEDGTIDLKLGGRIMNDWSFYSATNRIEDAKGAIINGTEFRRLRLFNQGTLHNVVSYKMEIDFAGGNADFKDVFIEINHLPVIKNLKIGHYKEPFGLEQLTSSKYITLMERSLTEAFVPGRNTGLMMHRNLLGARMHLAAGTFINTGDFGNGLMNKGHMHFTGRVTGLPLYGPNKKRYIHIGAAITHRQPNRANVTYKSKPESHLAPSFVDAGPVIVERQTHYSGEVAIGWDQFSFQGEYMQADYEEKDQSGNYEGYYGKIGFLLTGENRPYDLVDASFDRLNPKNNFNPQEGTWGAFELAGRYSELDLTSSLKENAAINNITAGMNWYMSPSVRIMFNYVLADHQNYDQTHIYQLRFQVDF